MREILLILKENSVETPASRFRQVLGERLAESARTPLPPYTARRIHGRVRFPGKATAVIGMRRAGKTTFLHQVRSGAATRAGSLTLVPYLSFEDERLIGLTASDLRFVLDEHILLLPAEDADAPVVWCFDEIQLVMGWERFVRRLLDERRSEVFVSGSSAALLSREVATSLRGGRGRCSSIPSHSKKPAGIEDSPFQSAETFCHATNVWASNARSGTGSAPAASPRPKVWMGRPVTSCYATTSMSQSCATWWSGIG